MSIEPKPRVVIIEGDVELGARMRRSLEDHYDICVVRERRAALEVLHTARPAVVTFGLFQDPPGLEEQWSTLSEILKRAGGTKVIVVTARDERDIARAAIGRGAYDFLEKPVDMDLLELAVRRALYVYRLEKEHRELQRQLSGQGVAGTLNDTHGHKLRAARRTLEKSLIQQAIARNKGNLTRAAIDLGISRPTLYELMDKLGIRNQRA